MGRGIELKVDVLSVGEFNHLFEDNLIDRLGIDFLVRVGTADQGAVEENVRFYKTHAWVNESDLCVAAFKLYNLGGKSVTIESVVVRGTEMDWPDVYWNRTSSLVFRDMNETTWANVTGTSFTLDNRNYVRATGNIFVRSGEMILVYMKTPSKRGDPSIIHRGNIGTPILLAVSTPNACHTIELIVEAAS